MRNLLVAGALALSTLWTSDALPCGGGFSSQVQMVPDQKIVIVHKDGVENYIFDPSFCGSSGSFGLILPVPVNLAASPTLVDLKILSDLDTFTAPQIQEDTRCKSSESSGCSGSVQDSAAPGGTRLDGPTVKVISTGQVGMLEFSVLQADTSKAFTDWLDTNKYPYDDKAKSSFDFYVTKKSFFVAFKVATPAGSGQVCGHFGPISLTFPAEKPYIPLRIAADTLKTSMRWRLFVIAPHQVSFPTSASDYASPKFVFSGPFQGANSYASLATLASEGDWISAGDLYITPSDSISSGDILLETTPQDSPARTIIHRTVEVDCDSCRISGPRGIHVKLPYYPTFAMLALGALLARRLRRSKHPS